MESTIPPAKRSKTTHTLQSMAQDLQQLKDTVASLVDVVHNLLPAEQVQANEKMAEISPTQTPHHVVSQNTKRQPMQSKIGQLDVRYSHMSAKNHPFHDQQGATKQIIPKGYCYKYNIKSRRCGDRLCVYRHNCPICQQKHPLYKCTFKQKRKLPTVASQSEVVTAKLSQGAENEHWGPKFFS